MTKHYDITGCSEYEVVNTLIEGLKDFNIVAYKQEDIMTGKMYLYVVDNSVLIPTEDNLLELHSITNKI